jgi:hypothetical protein
MGGIYVSVSPMPFDEVCRALGNRRRGLDQRNRTSLDQSALKVLLDSNDFRLLVTAASFSFAAAVFARSRTSDILGD